MPNLDAVSGPSWAKRKVATSEEPRPIADAARRQELQESLLAARASGNRRNASKVAALLGLSLLQAGATEQALHHLRAAKHDIARPSECPWWGPLTALITIAGARLSAEQAHSALTETRDRLAEEIDQLQLAVQEKSAQLLPTLSQPVGQGADQAHTPPGAEAPGPMPDASVQVRLLGRFRASLAGGEPLKLCANRKGRAIFKLLVSQPGHRLHREKLLDLLWRGEEPATAITKLHTAISRLRGALMDTELAEEPLLLDREHYQLSEELKIWTDLSDFQHLIERGRKWEAQGNLQRAIEAYEGARTMYRGDYLEDLVGLEWPLAIRAQCEQALLDTLERLSALYVGLHRNAEAADCCRQLLQHDDLREDIYRRLMRSLARSGQRNQALLLYKELEALLDAELGVGPMEETTQLHSRLRSED